MDTKNLEMIYNHSELENSLFFVICFVIKIVVLNWGKMGINQLTGVYLSS